MPSGRCLAYYAPKIKKGRFGSDQVHFMGVNSTTKKWEEQSMYGGKWAENIAQGVSRDVMAEAMPTLENAGYEILLTVHDEIIAEAPIGHGSLDEFNKILTTLPNWAAGLPVAVEGFESQRYRK